MRPPLPPNPAQFGSSNQIDVLKIISGTTRHPRHYTRFTDCPSNPNRTQHSYTPIHCNHQPYNLEPQGYQNNHPRIRFSEFSDFRTKSDIPVYSGQMNIPEFLDWVKVVDNFFEYMEVPKDKQVKMVAYQLKGRAGAWWERIQNARRRHGEMAINSLGG